MPSVDEAVELLCAGASQIHSREELRHKLQSGRSLRVKLGFDPSSPNLHLGHWLVLEKIAQFQQLGHTAVIIIGEYTARIGDPTGRSKTRPPLDPETIQANAKTYTEQVFKILDRSKTEIRSNAEWFDTFTYADVLRLNARMSVAQLLEREDFSKRYAEGQSITLTEFQYPLMQGHDSVMIRADVELGGNDQLFNNLVGRDLQRADGQEPQVVMVLPILVGTDGEQKMSKSLNNAIGITEPASEIFGKTMSVSDDTMREWRTMLGPYCGLHEPAPEHPMEAKKQLACALASRFHGVEAGIAARADFEAKFSKKSFEDAEIEEHVVTEQSLGIIALLIHTGAVTSSSEARRLIQQGAVKINGEKITDPKAEIAIEGKPLLQSGKKFFRRLTVSGS